MLLLMVVVMILFFPVANMLSLSEINPFSTKEASAYKEQPVIAAMVSLRDAYTNNDAKLFEKILGK